MTAESRHFLGFNARTWYTLVIAVAVSSLISGATAWAITDHFNADQNRQRDEYNRDQEKRQDQARRALQAKFDLALRINGEQNAYSINKSVCGFRGLLEPTLRDTRVPLVRRQQIEKFLSNQVTVPSHFKCKTLPKKPPA